MVTLGPAATSAPALLTRHAARVSRQLRESAPSVRSLAGLMAAYHMGWVDRDGRPDEAAAGKLVRPSLCLWACGASGTEPELAMPLACAVEWVHNFTLVHDDIQDGDRERRHRATVWSVWGEGQGINAGDALHALAFELLLAPGPLGGRRMRAARVLARAVRDVVDGQCRDLSAEGCLRADPAAYLLMAREKTGALLGACLEGGALIGGARAAVGGRLRRAGHLLGLAFQVRDDWLGIWGEPAQTGKSRDGDLARRKVSYPVVAGYAAMAPPERRRFRALFAAAADDGAVLELRSLLEAHRASVLAAAAAERFAQEAIDLVAACGFEAPSTSEFEEFARYVANRPR
jgi:geranylgeranyl diphosphate synthase, type I